MGMKNSAIQRPSAEATVQRASFTRRRHVSVNLPVKNNSFLSPAEQYIHYRSQMFNLNGERDLSPGSSISTSPMSSKSFATQMSHSEHMQAWRQKEIHHIQKKHPHRYCYGAPLQDSKPSLSTDLICIPQLLSPTSAQPTSSSSSGQPDRSASRPSAVTRKHKAPTTLTLLPRESHTTKGAAQTSFKKKPSQNA